MAYDYEYVHELVDRLTPDQFGEVRANALRLTAGRRAFVPWAEAQATLVSLPAVDRYVFRTDLDAGIDQEHPLATVGGRRTQRPA